MPETSILIDTFSRKQALKIKGAYKKVPFVFINPFRDDGYGELPLTPLSVLKLKEFCEEKGIKLFVSPKAEKKIIEIENKLKEAEEFADKKAPTYEFYGDLFPHQKSGLRAALRNYKYHGRYKFLIADDPRLGKSIQAVASLDIVASDSRDNSTLVLCPKAVVYQWKEYFKKWQNYSDNIFIALGTTEEKRAIVEYAFETKENPIIITNWESLYYDDYVFGVQWWAIIGDEAHKLKNRKSQISTFMREFTARNKILLSATFVERGMEDWFSPLQIVDSKVFSSFWSFLGHYTKYVKGYFGGYEVISVRNTDLRDEQLKLYILQRKSDDVADMPEKNFIDHFVKLDQEHQALYDRFEKEFFIWLESGEAVSLNQEITRLLRLRQVAIHPMTLDDMYSGPEKTAKFEGLEYYLEEVVPPDEQIIVYSSFKKSCQLGHNLFRGDSILYTGDQANEDDLKIFQEGLKRIMFSTPQKGGVGLNLFNANWVIYLDLPWSSIDIKQSEERVRAVGKKEPVTIVNLIAKNTVDEKIYYYMVNKLEGVNDAEIISNLKGNSNNS